MTSSGNPKRAESHHVLNEVYRSIDDAVNAYKNLIRDGRFVAGAGATEIELARRLYAFAEATPGVEQHAIKKFAEALEVIPRTLGMNAYSILK